eukprot:TRINITY_DN581_c0_g1_i1.p1 TRINITY_DN581_c0_g1~~TRINITY_DN581_c0_g1_i1.p1  ORF type:complete len:352 (+),score=133.48 TRINITY_DN581_c0_g1_i1:64-1056(+)
MYEQELHDLHIRHHRVESVEPMTPEPEPIPENFWPEDSESELDDDETEVDPETGDIIPKQHNDIGEQLLTVLQLQPDVLESQLEAILTDPTGQEIIVCEIMLELFGGDPTDEENPNGRGWTKWQDVLYDVAPNLLLDEATRAQMTADRKEAEKQAERSEKKRRTQSRNSRSRKSRRGSTDDQDQEAKEAQETKNAQERQENANIKASDLITAMLSFNKDVVTYELFVRVCEQLDQAGIDHNDLYARCPLIAHMWSWLNYLFRRVKLSFDIQQMQVDVAISDQERNSSIESNPAAKKKESGGSRTSRSSSKRSNRSQQSSRGVKSRNKVRE